MLKIGTFSPQVIEKIGANIANRMHWLGGRMMFSLGITILFIWLGLSWVVFKVEYGQIGSNITSYWDGVWWGIVTLLTVGYGDLYPVTVLGRILGMILMIVGTLAMGVLTAKISSHFLSQVLLEGRGIVDKDKLNNHFIVCGWQENMENLLLNILHSTPDLSTENLVLVANLAPHKVTELQSHSNLKSMKIVVGDAFHQSALDRVNLKKARKVLILSDRSPGPGGQIPTDSESDARTILTAITISNLARGTLVTAEILNPQLDYYLKMSGVGEIIYSREYSRLLIGKAAAGTGLSNIIYELLNPESESQIKTVVLEPTWFEKEYGILKIEFERTHPKMQVIGILENTGNMHRIKEQALREAQKTSDVDNFIKNLSAVKNLKCNNPIFNPSKTYIIKAGAAVIYIENDESLEKILSNEKAA